jgi:hypothetical protein
MIDSGDSATTETGAAASAAMDVRYSRNSDARRRVAGIRIRQDTWGAGYREPRRGIKGGRMRIELKLGDGEERIFRGGESDPESD